MQHNAKNGQTQERRDSIITVANDHPGRATVPPTLRESEIFEKHDYLLIMCLLTMLKRHYQVYDRHVDGVMIIDCHLFACHDDWIK